MDTIFLDIVNAYGMELLKAIVLLIGGTFGLIACKLATRCLNTETKRTLARTGVLFVEQVYKDLHGEEKMGKFLEYAAAQLKRYGIKFDAEEMKALAEAFLAEFNEAFNSAVIMDGIDVDSLTDNGLRTALNQMGFTGTENMTRMELLEALDEAASTVSAN